MDDPRPHDRRPRQAVNDLYAERIDVSHVRSWRSLALCRGMGRDLFFSSDPLDKAVAAQVCRHCPVRGPCSAVAEEIGSHCHGTWGGIWRG